MRSRCNDAAVVARGFGVIGRGILDSLSANHPKSEETGNAPHADESGVGYLPSEPRRSVLPTVTNEAELEAARAASLAVSLPPPPLLFDPETETRRVRDRVASELPPRAGPDAAEVEVSAGSLPPLDRRAVLADPRCEVALLRLGSLDAVVTVSAPFAGSLVLDPASELVLSFVDGATPVARIVESTGLEPADALEALAALVDAGLVSLVD